MSPRKPPYYKLQTTFLICILDLTASHNPESDILDSSGANKCFLREL